MSITKSKIAILIVVVFHAVGTIGTIVPSTRNLIVALTPVNLVISTALLYFISSRNKLVTLFFFAAFCLGLAVEILGVQRGFPFGEYQYGSILGPKLWGVPFVIGINWSMLSYAIGVIVTRFSTNIILTAMIGATMMVFLDFLIEPVALLLNYWLWNDGNIPYSNYIAWWGVSFALQMIFQSFLTQEKNSLATPLIVSQMSYFVCIVFFY